MFNRARERPSFAGAMRVRLVHSHEMLSRAIDDLARKRGRPQHRTGRRRRPRVLIDRGYGGPTTHRLEAAIPTAIL